MTEAIEAGPVAASATARGRSQSGERDFSPEGFLVSREWHKARATAGRDC